MWLLTIHGAYSVVQKNGTDYLTVRSRVKDDLEQLRRYMPDLGPITQNDLSDYEYRSTISHAGFAAGMVKVTLDVNYSNFKAEVEARQGRERHDVYMRVWMVLQSGLEALSRRTNWTSGMLHRKFRSEHSAWPQTQAASSPLDSDNDQFGDWWSGLSEDERAIFVHQSFQEDEQGLRDAELQADALSWNGLWSEEHDDVEVQPIAQNIGSQQSDRGEQRARSKGKQRRTAKQSVDELAK